MSHSEIEYTKLSQSIRQQMLKPKFDPDNLYGIGRASKKYIGTNKDF